MSNMDERVLQRLVDRQAIVDVVVQYATGVDRRDWELYAACFTDPCEFDFSGWRGQPPVVMSPQEWAARVRSTNGNFDTTQHLSTNHVVTFESDERATCVSDMHAQHWFSADRLIELGQTEPSGGPPTEPRWCTLGGFYTNTVVRTNGTNGTNVANGWRIARCQLDVTWTTGDPSIFDLARSLGDPEQRDR
jgi:hypothetical protein